MNKLESVSVSPQVNHALPQFAYSVITTARTLEDSWSGTDVRELNKLVVKAKMSDPVVIFRRVCLEEAVVMTTSDTSFVKDGKGGSQEGILTIIANSRCRAKRQAFVP